MPEVLVREHWNKRRIYSSIWEMVVKMSSEYREIAEYIQRFAEKEHITVEQALDYVMVRLFKEYKERQDDHMNSN